MSNKLIDGKTYYEEDFVRKLQQECNRYKSALKKIIKLNAGSYGTSSLMINIAEHAINNTKEDSEKGQR